MNWPELEFSPKATRSTPGVNVPVAAPSWALDLTRAASARSERPWAAGNCPAAGRWAPARSSIAGGSAAVELLVDWDAALPAAAELELGGADELELWSEDEDPQAARARAMNGTRARARAEVMP